MALAAEPPCQLIDDLRALGAAEIAFDVDFSTASNPPTTTLSPRRLRAPAARTILAVSRRHETGRAGDTRSHTTCRSRQFLANAWIAAVNVGPDQTARCGVSPSAGDRRRADAIARGDAFRSRRSVAREFPVDFSIRPETIDRSPSSTSSAASMPRPHRGEEDRRRGQRHRAARPFSGAGLRAPLRGARSRRSARRR